jgi:3-hydroxybutyryl-CoA dehydrogenase
MKSIQSIVVCGAGTMGSGIAQVAIQAGIKTIQFDLSETALAKSKAQIHAQINRLVEKGKIPESEQNHILGLIHFSTDIADCKADIIIEAIIEKKEAKIELFNKIAAFNDSTTIFATNTSSISVNDIAVGLSNPSMLVGMHFFNPAPIMKLVEVIAGQQSSSTIQSCQNCFLL